MVLFYIFTDLIKSGLIEDRQIHKFTSALSLLL